ncbi:MAG: hypothetical protein LW865_02030 [Betaproteobacteria bacterium]|nr:hypothetical protein [Rhodocyclaceae bacterium]MCE2722054.1 hypothetical protein [Betaproteobacteria bacterium]
MSGAVGPWQMLAEMGGCRQLRLFLEVLLSQAAPAAAAMPSPLAWEDYRPLLQQACARSMVGSTPASDFCYVARTDGNRMGALRERDLFFRSHEGGRAVIIGQLERIQGATIALFGFGELLRSRDWDLVSQTGLEEVRRGGHGLIAAIGVEVVNGFGQVRSTAWVPFTGNWQPALYESPDRDELRNSLFRGD